MAYKLQQAAMAGGVTPPAGMETISRKVQWKPDPGRHSKRRELPRYTVINLQEPPGADICR